jgi:hypothetical protein
LKSTRFFINSLSILFLFVFVSASIINISRSGFYLEPADAHLSAGNAHNKFLPLQAKHRDCEFDKEDDFVKPHSFLTLMQFHFNEWRFRTNQIVSLKGIESRSILPRSPPV